MKANKNNILKKDNPMFAFLPEMIIEHINHPEPKENKIFAENTTKEETENSTQPILFEPLADPFEGLNIEIEPKKKKQKK
jgi:hypothetical protein